jgi:hypothetical protein
MERTMNWTKICSRHAAGETNKRSRRRSIAKRPLATRGLEDVARVELARVPVDVARDTFDVVAEVGLAAAQ